MDDISDSIELPIKLCPPSHAVLIVTICTILLVLSWLTVSLRCYTRHYIVSNLGWDDYLVVAATVWFTCFCVLVTVQAYVVSNKETLTVKNIGIAASLLLTLEPFYIVTVCCLKVSLGIFFLRVLIYKYLRRAVYAVLIIFNLFSFVYFWIAVFQCGIPKGKSLWIKKIQLRCMPSSRIDVVNYSHAVLCAVTDLFFVLLIHPVVSKTHMRKKDKTIVSLLMGLSTLGFVASLVRIKWIPVLTSHSLDFFYDSLWLALSSAIEPGIGIIACCLATLRPLFKDGDKSRTTTNCSRSKATTLSNDTSPYNPENFKSLDYENQSHHLDLEHGVFDPHANHFFPDRKSFPDAQVKPTSSTDSRALLGSNGTDGNGSRTRSSSLPRTSHTEKLSDSQIDYEVSETTLSLDPYTLVQPSAVHSPSSLLPPFHKDSVVDCETSSPIPWREHRQSQTSNTASYSPSGRSSYNKPSSPNIRHPSRNNFAEPYFQWAEPTMGRHSSHSSRDSRSPTHHQQQLGMLTEQVLQRRESQRRESQRRDSQQRDSQQPDGHRRNSQRRTSQRRASQQRLEEFREQVRRESHILRSVISGED